MDEAQETNKVKFLFGQVVVTTVVVEAESEDKAKDEAKEWFKKPQIQDGKKDVYVLPWAEGGVMDTTKERDRVLATFLQLMQQVIPMTPCEKQLIVLADVAEDGKNFKRRL